MSKVKLRGLYDLVKYYSHINQNKLQNDESK